MPVPQRILADIHEILTAKYLNFNTFPDDVSRETYENRLTYLSTKIEHDNLIAKSEFTATYINEHIVCHNKIKNVYWTGKNISVSNIIGIDITDKECPADIILEYADGSFFGISLKSAKRYKANKTIGNYAALDIFRNYDMTDSIILEDHILHKGVLEVCPEFANMNMNERNDYLKANKSMKRKVDSYANEYIKKFRNDTMNKMNELYQKDSISFSQHINEFYLNSSGYAKLPYILVEVSGESAFKVYTDDIISRHSAILGSNLIMAEAGLTNLGIMTDKGEKIFRIFFKYKDRKLCGTLTSKIEVW